MSDLLPLIRRLADGAFHSGEALGAELGVSRAAIWKRLSKLQELGLELQAVHGRGYRLAAPLELLDAECIKSSLSAEASQLLALFEVHSRLDSTNSYLNLLAAEGAASGSVCLSEYQSGGRGRRGRRWVSPFGGNLYLSLLWRFDQGPAALGPLSLVVACALSAALESQGIDGLSLKWPNDLLLEGKKLAGILLEVSGEVDGPSQVVIGVGINYAMPESASSSIDQAWADLHRYAPALGRNRLAALIIEQLLVVISRFEHEGFAPFRERWSALDHYRDREVTLHYAERRIDGIARGVDESGLLLLEQAEGLRRYSSGEVSLRAAQ